MVQVQKKDKDSTVTKMDIVAATALPHGPSSEKLKAIEAAFAQIDKQFGKGSVMLLGQKKLDIKVEAISTGSILIDHALGTNGFPRGRIIEVFGPESSGKTTLTL